LWRNNVIVIAYSSFFLADRNPKRNAKYNENDKNKMPLVIFGDALFKRDNNRLKGNLPGVSSSIAGQIKLREKRGELMVMTIWEYNTSKVCIYYESTY
jgi:hypothetical protein